MAKQAWGNPRTKTWHISDKCPVVLESTVQIGPNGDRFGKPNGKTFEYNGVTIDHVMVHRFTESDNFAQVRRVHGYRHVCQICLWSMTAEERETFDAERFEMRTDVEAGAKVIGFYATEDEALTAADDMASHVSWEGVHIYDAMTGLSLYYTPGHSERKIWRRPIGI